MVCSLKRSYTAALEAKKHSITEITDYFLRFVNLTINITYSCYKNIMNFCMSFETVLHPLLFPRSKIFAGIEPHRLTAATCQL